MQWEPKAVLSSMEGKRLARGSEALTTLAIFAEAESATTGHVVHLS